MRAQGTHEAREALTRKALGIALLAVPCAAWGGERELRASARTARQQEAKSRPAQAAAPAEVRSKDGTRIAFDRAGEGPVLVLVSGALSDRSDTAQLARLLRPHFTVVNYDRRGRGASGDTAPYAVEREVEDIEALIDASGSSAFLFGHSSGAVLALEAANRLPAKVRRQVLFEPPFVVDDSRARVPADFVTRVGELVSAGRRGDAVEYFMAEGVGVPAEALAGMRALPMWAGMEALAHTLVYDGTLMGGTQAGQPLPAKRWASATATTLVMDGGASPPWLHAGARALADVLSHAEHYTLEGQDHSAAVMAPASLVPVLVEFLAD